VDASTVSVIIATYNAAEYLIAAVESLLAQTSFPLEIFVIDDGSTDDTSAIMEGYGPPVRYIRQDNAGVAAARNRGIAESRGRYVAFLDADDLWEPTKLERQLSALDCAGSSCRACYTGYLAVTADLVPLRMHRTPCSGSMLSDLLTVGNVVGTPSTFLVEREVLLDRGGFDPALSTCADWDMWLRLATVTDFAYVDEPLVRYRVHGTNMSRNVPLLERDTLLMLEKAFAMPNLPSALHDRRRATFARNYMVLAGSYFQAGFYGSFARCAAHALLLDPRQAAYLMAYPVRRLARRASLATTYAAHVSS
jgi:glycosyltransferase involved in cell wall biosynthesis